MVTILFLMNVEVQHCGYLDLHLRYNLDILCRLGIDPYVRSNERQ